MLHHYSKTTNFPKKTAVKTAEFKTSINQRSIVGTLLLEVSIDGPPLLLEPATE
jgi:hypothetical protein